MISDGRPTIVHLIHSLEGGGTERTLVAVLRRLDHDRRRHVVVTLREAGSLATQLPNEVACRPLCIHGRKKTAAIMLVRALRACRPAVIHARNTCTWGDAVLACVLKPRVQLVLGFHGLESDSGFNRRHQRWVHLALKVGARFTTVGESGQRRLAMEAGVPWNRVDLVRNGVEMERFRPLHDARRERVRAALGLSAGTFVFGSVASLTPVKRHALLIRAFARAAYTHPPWRLLIVGDGPLREALSSEAQRSGAGERVLFTGWREDVPDLLGAMDAYVCSSASESMSNAVLEALASGLPVVGTDVGDNRLMIAGRINDEAIAPAGVVVPSGSVTALAEAMLTIARDVNASRRLAAAARLRATRFDVAGMIRGYESLYDRLFEESARGNNARSAIRNSLSAFRMGHVR